MVIYKRLEEGDLEVITQSNLEEMSTKYYLIVKKLNLRISLKRYMYLGNYNIRHFFHDGESLYCTPYLKISRVVTPFNTERVYLKGLKAYKIINKEDEEKEALFNEEKSILINNGRHLMNTKEMEVYLDQVREEEQVIDLGRERLILLDLKRDEVSTYTRSGSSYYYTKRGQSFSVKDSEQYKIMSEEEYKKYSNNKRSIALKMRHKIKEELKGKVIELVVSNKDPLFRYKTTME